MITTTFVDKTSNAGTKRKCVKIGEYLAVAQLDIQYFRIYQIKQGLLFVDITFQTLQDAVDFAIWIDGVFGNFFPIWDQYPDADIVGLAKWSVENGIKIFELINLLSGTKTNKTEITRMLAEAERRVPDWTRHIHIR